MRLNDTTPRSRFWWLNTLARALPSHTSPTKIRKAASPLAMRIAGSVAARRVAASSAMGVPLIVTARPPISRSGGRAPPSRPAYKVLTAAVPTPPRFLLGTARIADDRCTVAAQASDRVLDDAGRWGACRRGKDAGPELSRVGRGPDGQQLGHHQPGAGAGIELAGCQRGP